MRNASLSALFFGCHFDPKDTGDEIFQPAIDEAQPERVPTHTGFPTHLIRSFSWETVSLLVQAHRATMKIM